MDPMLVVSAHYDDAALSMGQVLAGRPDAQILTVFGGCPKESTVMTDWDRNCGWANAGAALVGRHAEETAACAILNATATPANFLDVQYRELGLTARTPHDEDAIAAVIAAHAEAIATFIDGQVVICGPLGLKHPDHHVARRAVEHACRIVNDNGLPWELWLYEDLPGRVLYPEDVPDALDWWRGMGWDPVLAFLGTGPAEVKERAIRAYASQLWAPEFGGPALHNVLVPERLYRAWRTS